MDIITFAGLPIPRSSVAMNLALRKVGQESRMYLIHVTEQICQPHTGVAPLEHKMETAPTQSSVDLKPSGTIHVSTITSWNFQPFGKPTQIPS